MQITLFFFLAHTCYSHYINGSCMGLRKRTYFKACSFHFDCEQNDLLPLLMTKKSWKVLCFFMLFSSLESYIYSLELHNR